MNDHEPFTDANENSANPGPHRADTTPVVALTLGDIQARQDEIAAAILKSDPAARASVAGVVAMFRDEIARARDGGKGWAEIADALLKSGIVARPDAVRMAYRRLLDRPYQLSTRPSVRPTTTDQPVPPQRSDPPRSADVQSGKPPSLAPRIR